MAKLKLGKDFEITGEANEIKDVLANIGFDKNEILKLSNKRKTGMFWFILPVIIFFIITWIMYANVANAFMLKIVDLASFFVFTWVLVMAQLKFKNWKVTTLIGAGGVLVCLVARHYLTPLEATKKLEQRFDNQSTSGSKQDTAKSNDSSNSKSGTRVRKQVKPKRKVKAGENG